MIDEPSISPTPWTPWVDRATLTHNDDPMWDDRFPYGGAYVLGHFELPPAKTGTPPHLDEQTIYIGMTSTIRRRPRSHEKIRSHYKDFCKVASFEKLYISLYDIAEWFQLDAPQRAYIFYLERKLIWEYARRWNRLPILNRC